MISHINGLLVEKHPTHMIIECNGVGYHINISLNTYSKISDKDNCKLLTHLAIKEDSHALYGFYEESERSLFRLLISVSGIGTNIAITMLSSLSPSAICNAIAAENVTQIKAIKGIGPKTAQRVILELKDNLKNIDIPTTISSQKDTTNKSEALSALATLGFAKNNAEKVVDEIIQDQGSNISVEDLLKHALKRL